MKKLINVRYPLIAFLVVSVAVLSAVACVYQQILWAILAFFILSAVVVLCFVKGKRALALVILASYLLGLALSGAELLQIERRKVFVDYKVAVSGYVCDIADDNNVVKVVLDEVTITLQDGSTQKLAGKTRLYVYDDDTIVKLGTHVSVIAKVNNVYVFRDSVQALDYCNGIYYKLSSASDVVYGECNATLDKSFLNYVKERLQQVAPTNWSVAYALLTGDRSLVSNQTLEGFSDAGVMHVFAVSGLHVGFVVAVLSWLLGKLKVRRWARFFALIIPLGFYAFVCGFPPSVVRAVVMTAVSLLLQIFWHKTDLLNSASIAAVILVLANPLNLFNAGFLLSFGAVFGIATVHLALARYIDDKLKHKGANKLAKLVSVSLGATAGTVFITAYFFGEVATLAVVANLVVVPLVSVIFVFSALSLLPFFFGYLGAIPDVLLGVVKWFSNAVANIPFATVDTAKLGFAAIFWVALLFVVGGYVNIKGKGKAVVCIALALCMVASCVVANIPTQSASGIYMQDSDQDLLVIANDDDGNYLVVSNFTTINDTEKIIKRLDCYKINSLTLAFTNYKSASVNSLDMLISRYSVDKVYVFDATGNTYADNLFVNANVSVVEVPPNNAVACFDAMSIADGKLLGLQLTLEDFTFLIAYDISDVLLDSLSAKSNADVVYSAKYLPKLATAFDSSVVLFGEEGKIGDKNSLTECGNFTITCKSGTIKVNNGWGIAF